MFPSLKNKKGMERVPRVRWIMIFMGCAANAINYIDRANLAVAVPSIRHELGISAAVMGAILGAFFWTYAAMQMPFGWLADRIGARLALAGAVLWWSVSTMLTATARGAASLTGFRLLLGVGEAGAYPSGAKVNVNWFPRTERAIAASIFDSGSRIGAALSLPLVAWLIGTFSWRVSFAVTGLLGIVWTVFWLMIYRDPENHPSVTPEELARLEAERGAAATGPKVPWSSLFGYRTVWGMMIGFFCLNFVIYFFITWFPTYLMQARGFSLAQLGTLGLLPGLVSNSLRLARRLYFRRVVPPRLEPDRGAQNLPGGRHADVVRHHLFGFRAQRLCRARFFRAGLWQSRLYRRQYLVSARRCGAHARPCRVPWRHPEFCSQYRRYRHINIHGT